MTYEAFRRRPQWRQHYSAWITVKALPVAPWSTRVLTVMREPSDRGDIGWDVLQTIKDEMLGEDVYAVEVYPAATDIVADEYRRHLWEVPTELRGVFPFNLMR